MPTAKTAGLDASQLGDSSARFADDMRRMPVETIAQPKLAVKASGDMYVQRQVQGGAAANLGGGGGSQLSREYIELACEAIADIQRAVEEGRTWYFENEFLLQAEEWLEGTLVDARRGALQEVIQGLNEIIQDLGSGALVPTDPADRTALALLWEARIPLSTRALAKRWVRVLGNERLPNGSLQPWFPSLSYYIVSPGNSPPGMLPTAELSTWWFVGCDQFRQDEPEPPPEQQMIEGEFGPDAVIFTHGTLETRNGILRWDWEPRSASGSYPQVSGTSGPHEWHYDKDADRYFIVVDGQRVNLLPSGRVEVVIPGQPSEPSQAVPGPVINL